MWRTHLGPALTLAFAVLLLLLAITDLGPDAAGATVFLLVLAVAVLAVFLLVEQAVHAGGVRKKGH